MNTNPYLSLWEEQNTNKLIKELYWYYYGHGYKSILLNHLTKKILQPLILSISLLLISFNIEYIELIYIIYLISIGLIIHSLYGLYSSYKLINKINRQNKIYNYILNITEEQLQTANFSEIVEKILNINNNIFDKEELNELDIARIITLKDNYILGMINNGNLDKYLSVHKPLITYITIKWFNIILDYCGLFNNNDQSVKTNVIFSVSADEKIKIINKIKKRLRLIGLGMLIFMPIIIIGYLLTIIFTYAERIRNNPQFLSARQWTQLALYKFRDYNELPHEFKRRINKSYKSSNRYINYFDTHWICILSEFAIFVLGAIFFILLIMTFTNEEASYVLMLGIIGTIIALIRSTQPNEHKVYSYSDTMQEIVSNIHYLPNSWINMAHSPIVYKQFKKLFAYQIYNWFDELLSLLLCPYIFGINMANNTDKFVTFIQNNTITCEKIGYVYKLTLFENEDDYDEIESTEDTRKLQMSIINFRQNYPTSNRLFSKSESINMKDHLTKTFTEFNETNSDIVDDIEKMNDTFTDIVDDLGKLIEESEES